MRLASQNHVLSNKLTTWTLVLNASSFEPNVAFKIPFLDSQTADLENAENRGCEAIFFRRGRLKSEDRSEGGEDVTKATAS